MIVARTLPALRAACAALRRTHEAIGLVPTMGALHEGHRMLVRRSVASGAATVASIFVNPLQFVGAITATVAAGIQRANNPSTASIRSTTTDVRSAE